MAEVVAPGLGKVRASVCAIQAEQRALVGVKRIDVQVGARKPWQAARSSRQES